MKINIYIGFLLFLLVSAAALAEVENKYGLSQEAEFEEHFENIIKPHWEKNLKSGVFKASGNEDLNIAYAVSKVDDEEGAIVISSGRTESYLKYQELIYDLNRNKYSVYIHDHRGQGYSDRLLKDDRHKGHVEKFDDYVMDLNVFIEKVVKPKSHKKMFLLAHSMGGGIATRYIELFPNVFHAAALSSPMHAPDATILVSAEGGCTWFRWLDWACKDCYAGIKAKPYSPKPFSENEYTNSKNRYKHLLKIYSENTEIQLGGPTRGWAGQACAASKKMLDNVGSIRVPVLVLQASEDTAVTAKGQNDFCNNLKRVTGNECFGGKPIEIKGAKHELFIESDKYRNLAISTILDFYRTIE
jgi:lysophospholipase